MTTKLDYYDILGILVPGILLMCWIPVCFPGTICLVEFPSLPNGFDVLALTALAVFVGHVVQACASMAEPILYWTWCGRPSDRALRDGLGSRYFPPETARRIREKLEPAVGPEATASSMFLFAMHRAEGASQGRVSRFNSLYAYHRGLFVLLVVATLMLLGSIFWGCAASWGGLTRLVVFGSMALLCLLAWHRTKQRAFYYVREVLLAAESRIDEAKTTTTSVRKEGS